MISKRLNRVLVLSVPLLALSSKSTSLSAGFSSVSPGCTIIVFFFLGLLILSLLLLGLHSKSTSFSPGFCVHSTKQYNRIFWESDLFSGFLFLLG